MEMINLTPHALTVIVDGKSHIIPASGQIARVKSDEKGDGEVAGLPVVKTVYGPVEGLPEPQEGKAYIVSALVGSRVHGRSDVFGPNSGKAIRNEQGQIVGVPGLVRFE